MTRVVFMGSPDFAVPVLLAVADQFELAGVVTQPDRPAGRGGRLRPPPVKVAAGGLTPHVLQPESLRDGEVVARIGDLDPDLFIVAAYGKILPRAVLAIPRKGSLNVHASLLPRWRGASPIAAAILAGDAETGVTLMEMSSKMDAGPVVGAIRTPISEGATTGDLEPRLAALGAALVTDLVPEWLSGNRPGIPQRDEEATYCGILTKKDAHLAAHFSAIQAERAVRAYSPWPGAYVEYRGERLAIWRAHVVPGNASIGSLASHERLPAIGFAGGLLILDEVQMPGGRRIDGTSFLNGQKGKLESEVMLA